MAHDALRSLYIEQVQDMHSACTQSLPITRRLAEAATRQELKDALIDGAEGIERGRDLMDQIARAHGTEGNKAHCKGMEGLVAETQADVFGEKYEDDDVRDAAIVAMYQRMAHYAIAGYGTIRTFAARLGLDAEREITQQCLDKSYDGDKRFSDIAMGKVNPAAV